MNHTVGFAVIYTYLRFDVKLISKKGEHGFHLCTKRKISVWILVLIKDKKVDLQTRFSLSNKEKNAQIVLLVAVSEYKSVMWLPVAKNSASMI